MSAKANTQVRTTTATGTKFWWFLAPFLVGSGGWSYVIWWLLHETPTAIPWLVNLLTS